MDHEPYTWKPNGVDRERSATRDGDGTNFEFDIDPSSMRRRPQKIVRIVRQTIPVLLLTALLLVVAGQPNLALLFNRSHANGPVQITVVCDVPWAVIRVDGHGPAIPCVSGVAGALPMARLTVDAGQHTLIATAEGFTPYSIYIVAHHDTPGLYLTQFALTPQADAGILDAVNAYLARTYAQDVTFPATLWQVLGLRTPPTGSSLVVREWFEATSLDSYEPFYTETTYQRPITPEQGAIGVAVVVVEHVSILDDCGTATLLERRMPVLYATRASVTFSAHSSHDSWSVMEPYTLSPNADIYTSPRLAATQATPAGLLALTARTDLAAWLGNLSLLAGAVTATPLMGASHWAGGVVLTLENSSPSSPSGPGAGAHSDATWLYTAGVLTPLTPAAQSLSPHVPAALLPLTLNDLRARLASQPSRLCGGE